MKIKIMTLVNLQLTLENASQLATGLAKTVRNRSDEEREAVDNLRRELDKTLNEINSQTNSE